MKKIYRFNANNSCFFSMSHSPKKSNSSSCFKDKIRRISYSVSLLIQAYNKDTINSEIQCHSYYIISVQLR